MIKKERFPRIFFGWWTVLAGGFLSLWTGGFQTYGFSAFFKPIASELGFRRAVASVPAGISHLEAGFEGPLAGWAADKLGPRTVILAGIFLWGLAMILMYFVNSLWAFYIVWGVMLGTGIHIGTTVAVDTAIINWFVKKRGLAQGTKWVISGFSGALVALVAWLIINLGWRMTCVIGGVGMWLVGLPLVWFFVKPRRPEYYGLLPDGAAMEEKTADKSQMIDRGVEYAAGVQEVEFTLRQAMRTRAYWLLIVAQGLYGLVMGGINVHLVPYLTDIGISQLQAAGMMGIMVFSSIPMRLASGFIADRAPRNRIRLVIAGGYGLQTLSFAIFRLNPESLLPIYVWLVLYGIGQGASFTMFATVVGRYYGRKAYGSIRGSQMMFMAIPGLLAPIYAGWVYDTTGSYITVFMQFAVALAIAMVVMTLATAPQPPAQITDVRKIV